MALWAIDPDSNTVAWKTVVGTPWLASPLAGDGEDLSVIARDGREVLLKADLLAEADSSSRRRPSRARLRCPRGSVSGSRARARRSMPSFLESGSNYFWVQDPAAPVGWRKIGLPVALAARAIGWGSGVLVPGRDARAYLVDPLTGRASAEPFVPKFDRDHQGSWLSPAVVDAANRGARRRRRAYLSGGH